ncbi:MAG: cysteine desulfurase [Pirellulaceae bacterium]|nr:cysteine desulfurase [Pirellulaceae bacterium]
MSGQVVSAESRGAPVPAARPIDWRALRADFPQLAEPFEGRPLIYLDSAATSLKPRSVIESVVEYYSRFTANVHRGHHALSERTDALFDEARVQVARLIRTMPEQLIWTSGTTDGVNQVADMLRLTPADQVLVSGLEHHSNLLPYRLRATTHAAPLDEQGRIDPERFGELLDRVRPRLVALTHISNVLGTVQPLEELLARARAAGALTLVDAAQSVPRMPVDVGQLDCDFLVFSGHKMLGPTGIGGLYIRDELLDRLAPSRTGGGMVRGVGDTAQTWAPAPERFEAGTPHIAGAIGLGAAAEYLRRRAPLAEVERYERQLTSQLVTGLATIRRVRLWPREAPTRVGIVSFTVEGLPADEIAMLLSHRSNIMVRSGVHCAEPLARQLGVPGFVRASLYFYNSTDDITRLLESLDAAIRHLAPRN